jgi:endonuclease/exonuclease/phosphatase family metal-dependent hydrolase
VRIASYNVRYFGHGLKGLASTAASKARIAGALAGLTEAPDVIALQEVEARSLRAGPGLKGEAETQLEAFMRHLTHAAGTGARKVNWVAHYFPAHAYQLGGLKLYTTGLAVLVNPDTLKVVNDNRSAPKHITHYPRIKVTKQSRIVAHLHLEKKDGQRFHLFNTHLSLPTPFRREFWGQEVRMGFGPNQLAEAANVLTHARACAAKEPYLIVGDFNSAPGSPVYKSLTAEGGLVGAQEALEQIDPNDPRGFPTAGFMRLRMHLDHIFSTPDVQWVDLEGTRKFGDANSPFHGLSDHVPLLARFEL